MQHRNGTGPCFTPCCKENLTVASITVAGTDQVPLEQETDEDSLQFWSQYTFIANKISVMTEMLHFPLFVLVITQNCGSNYSCYKDSSFCCFFSINFNRPLSHVHLPLFILSARFPSNHTFTSLLHSNFSPT